METIRSVMGLSSKPEDTKEPVNAQTGPGTATEPYDAGNQKENLPSTAAHTSKPAAAAEPLNGTTGAGTATEPYDAGNQEENPPKTSTGVPDKTETSAPAITTTTKNVAASTEATEASVAEPLELTEPKGSTAPTTKPSTLASETDPPSKAVVSVAPEIKKSPNMDDGIAPGTKSAEAGGAISSTEPTIAAAASAQWSGTDDATPPAITSEKAIAPAAAVGATTAALASKTESTRSKEIRQDSIPSKEIKETAKSKEPTIGSSSWFKNTINRRKSKTPDAESGKPKESKTPAAIVEHEKTQDNKPIAAAVPIAETKPKENTSAAVAPPVPVVKKETKPVTTQKTTTAETKPRKERSLSRDFKLFKGNPFKRNSKAGIEDEKVEETSKTSTKPAAASAVAGGAVGAAIAAEPSKDVTPVKDEPVVAGESVPSAAPVLPEKPTPATGDSALHKDSAMFEDPTLTDATNERESEKIGAIPETSTKHPAAAAAAEDDDIAPDQVTSKAAADEDIAPDQVTSKAVDDEDIAPDTVAPHSKDPVTDTDAPTRSRGLEVPVINEPSTDASEDKGKSVVSGRRPSYQANSENTSAIPTAGGIRLGEKAMEERRGQEDRRQSIAPPSMKESSASKPAASKVATASEEKSRPAATNASDTKNASGVNRQTSVLGKLKARLKA